LAGQLNFFASNSSVRPVSGTEVRSVCYGNPSDSAAGYLSSDEVTGLVPLLSVGDWTGDGVDEWAMLRGSRDVGGAHSISHGTALVFGGEFPARRRRCTCGTLPRHLPARRGRPEGRGKRVSSPSGRP
jgi:hypothetical protein